MQIIERVLLSLGFGAGLALFVYIGADYVLSYWTPDRPARVRSHAARVLAIGFALFYLTVWFTSFFGTWEFAGGILMFVIVLTTFGKSLLVIAREK
jgi:hypothetical protein